MTELLDKLKSISLAYIIWIGVIAISGIWSVSQLSFNPNFPYYNDIAHYGRHLSSFAHFDGIHYLRIIDKGYDDTGSQAFFPFYPLLMRSLNFFSIDPLYFAITLNSITVFATMYLVSLRLSKSELNRFVYLFFSVPTSFFLIANYTESVFIFLVVLFFHLQSKRQFFFAALVAGVASMTRLVGGFLALSLLVEMIRLKKLSPSSWLLIPLGASGTLGYMYYLYSQFGDPLMFIHVQSMFNNGRSGGDIVLLPQVLYRYAKIILTVNPGTILFMRAAWELLTFCLSFAVMYYYRHKIPLSGLIFCIFALILPTISGTLSSYPRYLLVAYPIFIAMAKNFSQKQYLITVLIQCAILIISVALFVQGIFIA